VLHHISIKCFFSLAIGYLTLWPIPYLSAQNSTAVTTTQLNSTTSDQLVIIGTYTDKGTSEGIYLFRFLAERETLEPVGIIRDIDNPSFIAIHPNGRVIYAVSEVRGSSHHEGGSVSAYEIDFDSLKVTFLNKVSTGCAGPCHLTVDSDGRNVFVAHYTGGAVSSLALHDNGRLQETHEVIHHKGSGPHSRQEKPHTHSVNMDPSNRFALVADLGIDRIMVYDRDTQTGHLKTTDSMSDAILHPGAGPRHLAVHPFKPFAYVINELDSTVSLFFFDEASGFSAEKQTISTLPADFKGRSATAEIKVSPSGKFLYGSNRGHDSLVIYALDEATGILELRGHQSTLGKNPRNFEIDSTGNYLFAANQDTNDVSLFRIYPHTGELAPIKAKLDVPRPVCIKLIPIRPQTNDL
jgi:6-phosphogluconolactonase